jgi:cyanate permease
VKESTLKEVLWGAMCVAQVVECLPNKGEALNSKPSTAQKTNLKILKKPLKWKVFYFCFM